MKKHQTARKEIMVFMESPDWRLEKVANIPKGLSIYTHEIEKTSRKAGLGVFELTCGYSPLDFVNFVNGVKFSMRKKFVEIRKRLHPKYAFYQSIYKFDKKRADLVHFRWKSPSMIVQDRDYVILRNWRYWPEKKYAIIYGGSIDNSGNKIYPKEQSCTRAKLLFSFIVRKVQEDTLRVEAFAKSDFGGFVPSWIFNNSVNEKSKRVFNYCKEFLNYMKEEKKRLEARKLQTETEGEGEEDEEELKKTRIEKKPSKPSVAPIENIDVLKKREFETDRIRKKIEGEYRERVKELQEQVENLKNRNKNLTSQYAINDSELSRVKTIGRGAMGVVDLCEWKGSGGGVEVAVKTIQVSTRKISHLQEVEKEFETMALLHHNRILRLYGYCTNITQFSIKIVMELMDMDLHEYLKIQYSPETKSFTNYEKFRIMKKMTQGICYIHSKNVLHRDIKSYNFLVSQDGEEVKLTDFGSCKLLLERASPAFSTYRRGTVHFKPPETIPLNLMAEEVPYSEFSDVYMLGVSFYEVVYGYDPFHDFKCSSKGMEEQVVELLREIKGGLRPTLHEKSVDGKMVPKVFQDLMKSLWNEDPRKRRTAKKILKWFDEHEEEISKM